VLHYGYEHREQILNFIEAALANDVMAVRQLVEKISAGANVALGRNYILSQSFAPPIDPSLQ
ncbi:hypothetical protein, partial [Sphingomonas sp. 10B4]|uniref:hypothetical protein n=1 Tax=Sphingomonas sp. 10B4 TaxID=3048575 RepID=UPI002B23C3DF